MSIISDETGAHEMSSFAMNIGRRKRSFFHIRAFFILGGEWVTEMSQIIGEDTLKLNLGIQSCSMVENSQEIPNLNLTCIRWLKWGFGGSKICSYSRGMSLWYSPPYPKQGLTPILYSSVGLDLKPLKRPLEESPK